IDTLANAGSTQLCLNGANRVGPCSSSLRYKTGLAPYRGGLSVVSRLRPISFTWKDRGIRDLGFGAEEVEKIDPLLVVYNAGGEVEGVKYDRLNVVLVNAIKEQQKQIEQQQGQIVSLYKANASLNARLRMIERRVVSAKTRLSSQVSPGDRREGRRRSQTSSPGLRATARYPGSKPRVSTQP